MVTLSHPKTPMSLHIFSTNKSSSSSSSPSSSSSSSSSITNMKLKSLIHNLIFSQICRIVRVFSKAKTIFLDIFRDNHLMCVKLQTQRKNKYMKKILFGSFRLHYNWCSSNHVMPFPSPNIVLEGISVPTSHIYYDSTWNSVFSTDNVHDHGSHNNHQNDYDYGKDQELDNGPLSSYLQWLEEKGCKHENTKDGEGNTENEIDKLADMFIADCHEKFRLEKIESYRRYQELLARTM